MLRKGEEEAVIKQEKEIEEEKDQRNEGKDNNH